MSNHNGPAAQTLVDDIEIGDMFLIKRGPGDWAEHIVQGIQEGEIYRTFDHGDPLVHHARRRTEKMMVIKPDNHGLKGER